MHQQQGQERSLLRASQGQEAPVGADLERAEDPEFDRHLRLLRNDRTTALGRRLLAVCDPFGADAQDCRRNGDETGVNRPGRVQRVRGSGLEQRTDGYHDFFGPITTRVIDQLLDAAEVERGMRVLDAASGPGYVAAACAERGADVVGVDVTAEMVSLARTLCPGLEFRQADAEQLPFEDGAFDAVLANFLILHVGRPEQVAAGLARVLRPGAKLALSTWDVPERARLLGVLVEAVAEAGGQPTTGRPARAADLSLRR